MQDLPSALRSLQRLQAKNFVDKFADAQDKRIQNWRITQEGRDLEGILPAKLIESFDEFLAGFPRARLDEINKGVSELLEFLTNKNP